MLMWWYVLSLFTGHLHGAVLRFALCFIRFSSLSFSTLSDFCYADEKEISLSHTVVHKMLMGAVWYRFSSLCQRPGKLTLPVPAPPFQEEITVSWIINENKLASIKYWKGNVCMLTIKMASEALTCLKDRACQPNASSYLPGISQH